jgi:hypothetical protein
MVHKKPLYGTKGQREQDPRKSVALNENERLRGGRSFARRIKINGRKKYSVGWK